MDSESEELFFNMQNGEKSFIEFMIWFQIHFNCLQDTHFFKCVSTFSLYQITIEIYG